MRPFLYTGRHFKARLARVHVWLVESQCESPSLIVLLNLRFSWAEQIVCCIYTKPNDIWCRRRLALNSTWPSLLAILDRTQIYHQCCSKKPPQRVLSSCLLLDLLRIPMSSLATSSSQQDQFQRPPQNSQTEWCPPWIYCSDTQNDVYSLSVTIWFLNFFLRW